MKKLTLDKQRGFTLIELLIVVAILGITMGAIYSLYTTHQRSAYVSDEVVEVQQNLRIAIDSMTRDIRMAGFMVPRTTPPTNTPVDGVSTATEITLNLGAQDAGGPFAVIAQPRVGLGQFTVTTDVSVDQFSDGDFVTIIRPNLNNIQVGGVGNRFLVTGRNRAGPTITLAVTPGPVPPASVDTGETYLRSDLIVRSGALFPNQIRYCLGSTITAGCLAPACPAGQQCLMKSVNGGVADIIAQNLNGLQISYLLDNLPETNAPAPANFSIIRAVRVRLTGGTVATIALSDNVAKQRQIESIIQIRNKFD